MIFDRMFTLVQALDLIGLLQCVFILAIVVLKAADIRQAGPTVAFFAALGLSFGLPATISPQFAYADIGVIWIAQAWIPTLSYLLILQVAIGRLPPARHFLVLALPLIGPPAVLVLVSGSEGCAGIIVCPETVTLMRVFGVVLGGLILLLLWLHRGMLMPLRAVRDSRDRYWVVLALIVFNVLNLGVDLPRAAEMINPTEATLIRAILGLTFVYLVTTLVFRIDPKPVVLLPGMPRLRRSIELTPEELAVAERIKELMTLDKLYQEPTFSRADLARELNVSENVVSRVINGAFSKSFRQLLNEHRVAEATQLLRSADMQVTQIAFDVGFTSLASFNRVFKEVTAQSPTEFRAADVAKLREETADEKPETAGDGRETAEALAGDKDRGAGADRA